MPGLVDVIVLFNFLQFAGEMEHLKSINDYLKEAYNRFKYESALTSGASDLSSLCRRYLIKFLRSLNTSYC